MAANYKRCLRNCGILLIVLVAVVAVAAILVYYQFKDAHEMAMRRLAFSIIIKAKLKRGIEQGEIRLKEAVVDGPGAEEPQAALTRIGRDRVAFVTYEEDGKSFFFVFSTEPFDIISKGILAK